MQTKLIVLDFYKQEVHTYPVNAETFDTADAEKFITEKGHSMEDIQWMITSKIVTH